MINNNNVRRIDWEVFIIVKFRNVKKLIIKEQVLTVHCIATIVLDIPPV